jgi:hypothetical protein
MNTTLITSALLALTCSLPANAYTILQPTDGDVNIFIDFGSLASLADGHNLYMFDDSVTSTMAMATANSLLIASNQIVGIFGPVTGGNYIATASDPLATLSLTDSSRFILGISNGTDWLMDEGAGILSFGANSETIRFNASNSAFLTDVSATIIPLPAAVWLFGAGLLGMVGLARRPGNTQSPEKGASLRRLS